jgi:NACalpha-BTF3-like transcription factor
MYPEDIKKLFPQVPVGTPVTVVDQPIKVGWIGEELFIEVSPSQDQAKAIEESGVLNSYEITKDDIALINKRAGVKKDQINWEKVRQAVKNHSGYPVAIIGKGESAFKPQTDATHKYSIPESKALNTNKRVTPKQAEAESVKQVIEDNVEVKVKPQAPVKAKAPQAQERVNIYGNAPQPKTTLSNVKLRTRVNE